MVHEYHNGDDDPDDTAGGCNSYTWIAPGSKAAAPLGIQKDIPRRIGATIGEILSPLSTEYAITDSYQLNITHHNDKRTLTTLTINLANARLAVQIW